MIFEKKLPFNDPKIFFLNPNGIKEVNLTYLKNWEKVRLFGDVAFRALR